jgi:hypothetical protein
MMCQIVGNLPDGMREHDNHGPIPPGIVQQSRGALIQVGEILLNCRELSLKLSPVDPAEWWLCRLTHAEFANASRHICMMVMGISIGERSDKST